MTIKKILLTALVTLTTSTVFALSENRGTGEIISMTLNLENCEGIDFINYSSGYNLGSMLEAMNKYGPIRVCYPNKEISDFSKYPQPVDPNSDLIIISSNEKNDGPGIPTDGSPILIIALKNGKTQHPGKTRLETSLALANGIEIVKGLSPEELEMLDKAGPVDPSDNGLE